MSKNCNPGELRTPIDVLAPIVTVNENGFPVTDWQSIWGGELRRVRWVNIHGREVWEAASQNLIEAATITMRYDPLVKVNCRVRHNDEDWEIVSLDNIRERGRWLEIKVKKVVSDA